MADPSTPPDPTVTNTVMTGLLGLVGAVLSLLFGGHDLKAWGRIGCLLAGVACAVVFGPLVTTVWKDCPPQVLSATGFVLGLGGLFLVRGLLAFLRQFETRIPWLGNKLVRDKTGLDLSADPPAPPVPPVSPVSPPKPSPEKGAP